MFQRIIQWQRDWENEILAVLTDPALALAVRHGFRRRTAQRLASMSLVERQQTQGFIAQYRGLRGYLALGKLLLAFGALGVMAHLLFPDRLSLISSVAICTTLGTITALSLLSIWFNYRRMPVPNLKSYLWVIALACIGAVAGASVMTLLGGQSFASLWERIGRVILWGGLGLGSGYALVYGLVAAWRRKEYEMLTAALQMQAEQDRLARKLSESRLRMLQAQIEPHFLFNTLGAVQQLAQTESPRAAELTANLITFLRASLGDMRTEQMSLQAEWTLVEAYLKVMKARLGSRLEFEMNLAPALTHFCLPGMLVLTLVENAIKHGIEPALRGGRIDVSARCEGDVVCIAVADTGAGQAVPSTFGRGLSNLKERLHLAYGDAGHLDLSALEPSGMLATLTFPMQPSTLMSTPVPTTI